MLKKRIYILVITLFITASCLAGTNNNLESIFTNIYNKWLWAGKESVSGSGSDTNNTKIIRNLLPEILKELNTKVLVDAPCGDLWWMQKTDLSFLDKYYGIDIVQGLIDKLTQKHVNNDKFSFLKLDLSTQAIPKADTILCRDLFLHLKYEQIFKVLENFKESGAKYLICSTYANAKQNKDINVVNSGSRPVNLELAPFNFKKPLILIDEKHHGKFLGVWEISQI